ncbi:MAG: hypothetical protein RBT15_09380 [Gudongella sp.]|jgi:hypothetical protein|nr:hypothetical protein [Gudongella sp.]
MSKRLSNDLKRQNRAWEKTQEKRRRLLKGAAAKVIASTFIASSFLVPISESYDLMNNSTAVYA